VRPTKLFLCARQSILSYRKLFLLNVYKFRYCSFMHTLRKLNDSGIPSEVTSCSRAINGRNQRKNVSGRLQISSPEKTRRQPCKCLHCAAAARREKHSITDHFGGPSIVVGPVCVCVCVCGLDNLTVEQNNPWPACAWDRCIWHAGLSSSKVKVVAQSYGRVGVLKTESLVGKPVT